jgi:hypothetical protein
VGNTPEPQSAREVLEYFLNHPSAADSLEGIARWRLMNQQIDKTVQETSEAIEWLVLHGYLIEAAVSRSGQIYRLNPQKQSAAKRLLRKKTAH